MEVGRHGRNLEHPPRLCRRRRHLLRTVPHPRHPLRQVCPPSLRHYGRCRGQQGEFKQTALLDRRRRHMATSGLQILLGHHQRRLFPSPDGKSLRRRGFHHCRRRRFQQRHLPHQQDRYPRGHATGTRMPLRRLRIRTHHTIQRAVRATPRRAHRSLHRRR